MIIDDATSPYRAVLYVSLAITLALCAGAYAYGWVALVVVLAGVATVILAAIALSFFFFLGLKRLARSGDCNYITKLGRMFADGRSVPLGLETAGSEHPEFNRCGL